MKKYLIMGLVSSTLLFACSTTTSNLSSEDEEQLETHSEEVQDKIDNPSAESLPAKQHRFWQKPSYENQQNILGYTPETFAVPEALKERVQFWVNIYTNYTTSQGILHDSRYTSVIYEPVDFTKLDSDKNLSQRQRLKAEKKYLDERKKYVKTILTKLQGIKDPTGLSDEEMRYWKMFEKIDEKNKFTEASKKGRLRFQLGQKDRFIQGIFYSGRYLREMEQIFAANNMPKELTRLPFVESSFNIRARSKVGASGIWQFMRSTGRLYMKVNGTMDQRNDPLIATKAASKLLKTNYEILQQWPLAVTAYNYGAAGLKKIVEKYKTNDLANLYGINASSRFGFASESFYTSFLAALEVERNADKYFGKVEIADEVPSTEISVTRALYFKEIKSFYANEDEIANLNPQFTQVVLRNQVRVPANTILRVPENQKQAFMDFLSRAPAVSKEKPIEKTIQTAAGKESSAQLISYTVNKGDTLYDISKQFQISIDRIMQVNQDLDPRVLKPGQVIEIPQ
jgi:membrane-bound lytic murein transglycosylase D